MSGDPASRRAAVLGSVRAALGRGELSADAQGELDRRVKAHRANLQPARAKGERAEIVARFIAEAKKVECTVAEVAAEAAVPAAVADYLRQHNLPGEIAAAPDPWIQSLPWAEEAMLHLTAGASTPADQVAVTPAFGAVAETGTLVMTSGPDHPTSLNFTPESHLVVLREEQIVGAYEEVWARLREMQQDKDDILPRTVNMITGPSRTGDINMQIFLGAHGPRRLHIVLIKDD